MDGQSGNSGKPGIFYLAMADGQSRCNIINSRNNVYGPNIVELCAHEIAVLASFLPFIPLFPFPPSYLENVI